MPDPHGTDLLRAAVRIRQRIIKRSQHDPPLALPEGLWRVLRRASHLLSRAQTHGWRACVPRLRGTFDQCVWQIKYRLEDCQRAVERVGLSPTVASLREMWEDLNALAEEFEEVRCNLRERTLTAVTDTIVLDELELGRFAIVLDWGSRNDFLTYAVVALDSNPASTDSDVTHPHVRDEQLCEGEGRVPIRTALATGRLGDFFLLVRQILQTYNPTSAHVLISRWDGSICHDCGYLAPPDDLSFCERCHHDVCLDCCSNCCDCGLDCCSGCRSECHGCGHSCCTACLQKCRQCQESFCSQCLTQGQCKDCQETEEPSNEPALTPPHRSAPAPS